MSREELPAVSTQPPGEPPSLGWREWVTLPGLGIGAIKAKLDSGARSSSLHVETIETFLDGGARHARFHVRVRRKATGIVVCTAPVLDRRRVTDSGGHRSERWFILVELQIAQQRFVTEMNLTDRGAMLFPLLLGRSAIGGRFRIDPACSYTCPRPSRTLPENPRIHA